MSRVAAVITQTAFVSSAWLLLSLLFCGIGALARRGFHARLLGEGDMFFDWWVGWSLTLVFLLAWHLAMPITTVTLVPLALAGFTGAWMSRAEWRQNIRGALGDRPGLATLVVLAWLAVAALALGPDQNYDTGLYHLQSIRWAQAFPVVRGLGNIDSRFGMNSSFFLFGALVETVKINGRDIRLASGILFLLLIVQGIISVYAAVMRKREMDVVAWFQALMIPVAFWKARQYAPALSPDGAVFALTVVLSGELLRMFSRNKPSTNEAPSVANADYRVFGFVVLAAVAVTVKLSSGIFVAAAATLAVWKWTRLRPRWATLVPLATASVIIAAVWMIHGVLLSGYVAYPSTLSAVAVDWRVPSYIAQLEADWIASWARKPGGYPFQVLANHDWLPGWLARTARDRDIRGAALVLAVAGIVAVSVRLRRRQWTNPLDASAILLLLPSLLAAVFWFVTAPAVRFILGPLWVVAAGTLAVSLAGAGYSRVDKYALRIVLPASLALIMGTAFFVALNESSRPPSRQALKQMTTNSGLTIFLPLSGDRCGDAPLPCASRLPEKGLELRKPGSFASGFRVAR